MREEVPGVKVSVRRWCVAQRPLGAREHLIKSKRRHCERSEAIHVFDLTNIHGLPRRYAPRNDGLFRCFLL